MKDEYEQFPQQAKMVVSKLPLPMPAINVHPTDEWPSSVQSPILCRPHSLVLPRNEAALVSVYDIRVDKQTVMLSREGVPGVMFAQGEVPLPIDFPILRLGQTLSVLFGGNSNRLVVVHPTFIVIAVHSQEV